MMFLGYWPCEQGKLNKKGLVAFDSQVASQAGGEWT